MAAVAVRVLFCLPCQVSQLIGEPAGLEAKVAAPPAARIRVLLGLIFMPSDAPMKSMTWVTHQ